MTDVMVYIQHLLGIGHVRRMALINQKMRGLGLGVTVISGGMPDEALDYGTKDVIQLPPCRTADSTFATLVDQDGIPVDDAWKERRRTALLAAFAKHKPKVLLVEMFPFGRRAFRFELIPLFDAAKQAGIPIVCSVRDLLVRKKDDRKSEWMRDVARRYLDRVIVHGDPILIRFEDSFPFADDIGDLISYSGYVAPVVDAKAATRQGVLVSAGGGAVGGTLLERAIAARSFSQKYHDARWDIVAGPNLAPEKYETLQRQLPDGVYLYRFLSDFRQRMAGAAVSVSQAGYNTLMDVLATQTPAVMVPFAEDGESEQSERATILARQGVISLLDLSGLTAQSLAKQIDDARKPDQYTIALDGAEKSAGIIAGLIREQA
ncbi:glycosyl transferase [Thalassospira sp. MA62]|nr:glycosyl transferase [Thalassospira sp. MA62]